MAFPSNSGSCGRMEADDGMEWMCEVDATSFDAVKAEDIRPPPGPGSDHKEKLFLFTNLAIQSFNLNHLNNRFELVDPLHLRLCFANDYDYPYDDNPDTMSYHLSFIARSNSDCSVLKLFFAEISFSSDTVGVERCFIVEPGNPLFVAGCLNCHPDGVIYHRYWEAVSYEWDPSGATFARPPPLSPRSREFCAKRFLSKAYTIKSYPEKLIAEDVDELRRTAYPYADDSISDYNRTYATAFEAIEIVAFVRFRSVDHIFGGDLWAHLIFKAMRKDLTNASPVYFFGEVALRRRTVISCVMIGEELPKYSRDETSCAVCREHCPMFHPEGNKLVHYEGQFADALYEDKGLAQKAKLEQKVGESIEAARLEYWEELDHLQW